VGGGFRIVCGDKQYQEFHDAASLLSNLKTCKREWMYIAVREREDVHSLFVAIARNMVEINEFCLRTTT
jgi:hypothetical protein